MRTPHSGQNTPVTSLPLSAMRVIRFVRPVTVRLSFFTGMNMPKALPDWRWHSLPVVVEVLRSNPRQIASESLAAFLLGPDSHTDRPDFKLAQSTRTLDQL